MSAKDGFDGKEPVEHDRFDEELARFLSDDWQSTREDAVENGDES